MIIAEICQPSSQLVASFKRGNCLVGESTEMTPRTPEHELDTYLDQYKKALVWCGLFDGPSDTTDKPLTVEQLRKCIEKRLASFNRARDGAADPRIYFQDQTPFTAIWVVSIGMSTTEFSQRISFDAKLEKMGVACEFFKVISSHHRSDTDCVPFRQCGIVYKRLSRRNL